MTRRRTICLLTPSLVPYDAIGNDVAQMRVALAESGHNVRIFAGEVAPACSSFAEPLHQAPPELWRSPENILIYHHSTGWPRGEEILFNTRNNIVLRYHNITPARFFCPYSPAHTESTEHGIESTKRIAKLSKMLIVGDSTFNCEDLISLGAKAGDCRVLPPFHLTEELGREPFDFSTRSQYSGAITNILFVGSVKPNKGHSRAIRVFSEYHRRFNHRSRLIFAGGIDERLREYVNDLHAQATRLGIAEHVIFTGGLTGAQIKTLYVSAAVFLCTSEHEGFCVPLVESMYFRVPIVAWGVTAVPETMGKCGFVLDDWNEAVFAAHIHSLVQDPNTAERLAAMGRERYHEAFTPAVLRKKLDSIIAEVIQ